ncbi:MAG: GNAT family N-acetyltransferase [Roseburia sp.]|nr:GNAT family N-acetyltransferase [Roseburia sp.]
MDTQAKKEEIRIRAARLEDAERLLEIYAPYVTQTAITFENDVPTLEEFTARMSCVLEKYPYLAAEQNGVLVGYAYAGTFKNRAAYDWAVETSIYVRQDKKRAGIGSRLYEALEMALKSQGILNLNACIAYAVTEDEYLTNDSVRYHERCGYKTVAHFHQCGYKFGRWYDMVWMEKLIGEHTANPPRVRPYGL